MIYKKTLFFICGIAFYITACNSGKNNDFSAVSQKPENHLPSEDLTSISGTAEVTPIKIEIPEEDPSLNEINVGKSVEGGFFPKSNEPESMLFYTMGKNSNTLFMCDLINKYCVQKFDLNQANNKSNNLFFIKEINKDSFAYIDGDKSFICSIDNFDCHKIYTGLRAKSVKNVVATKKYLFVLTHAIDDSFIISRCLLNGNNCKDIRVLNDSSKAKGKIKISANDNYLYITYNYYFERCSDDFFECKIQKNINVIDYLEVLSVFSNNENFLIQAKEVYNYKKNEKRVDYFHYICNINDFFLYNNYSCKNTDLNFGDKVFYGRSKNGFYLFDESSYKLINYKKKENYFYEIIDTRDIKYIFDIENLDLSRGFIFR